MEIYITTNSKGYVDGYSYSEINPGYKIQIHEDDPFFQRGFASFKCISGKLVSDEEEEKRLQLEKQLRDATPSLGEQMIATQEALVDVYEENANLRQQLIDMQLVMVELYEANL